MEKATSAIYITLGVGYFLKAFSRSLLESYLRHEIGTGISNRKCVNGGAACYVKSTVTVTLA